VTRWQEPLSGYVVLEFWNWSGLSAFNTTRLNFTISALNAVQVCATDVMMCACIAGDDWLCVVASTDAWQIYENSLSGFLAEAGCEATECVLKYYLYDEQQSLLSQNFYFFSSLSVCG
jgi:hypothetical protein